MIRNFDRRYEIQKIHRIRYELVECYRNAKIRNARTSTRIMFANALCLACSPPKRIPRCVSRCATKAQQVRAAHRKERTLERKPTPTIIFPFFSLSLLLSFFSSVEYNSSPCSKILKIVVPADVSQWH